MTRVVMTMGVVADVYPHGSHAPGHANCPQVYEKRDTTILQYLHVLFFQTSARKTRMVMPPIYLSTLLQSRNKLA